MSKPTCLVCGTELKTDTAMDQQHRYCPQPYCGYRASMDRDGIPAAHNALAEIVAAARDIIKYGDAAIEALENALDKLDKFKVVITKEEEATIALKRVIDAARDLADGTLDIDTFEIILAGLDDFKGK